MRIRPSKALTFLTLLLLALVCAGAARAQDALPVASCGTLPQAYKPGVSSRVTVDLNGNLCISGNISAATSLNAASTLPTLVAGSQPLQGSLAGALYVQPTFGTASGGGTQVDLTHGLPVQIVAGGGSGGTASSFAAPFPATGTAAGFKDGSGNMQPGTVDGAGNQNVNLQTALPAGGNAIGSVSVSNFPATQPVSGTVTANQGGAPWLVATGCAGATIANTKSKPFSNAGSASNLKLVAGVAAQKVYVCAINVGPVAGAVNVALVEGTKVTNECDTGTAGVMGGATAATGWNFAANGGLTMGSGAGILAQEATAADDLCLFFSGAVQVSGVITYAQF